MSARASLIGSADLPEMHVQPRQRPAGVEALSLDDADFGS
jgi:hypothetical protein